MDAREFHISIPQDELDDLRKRLLNTRWPNEPGGDERYGAPRAFLEPLLEYWRDEYEWRTVEAEMNAFQHYIADIDGVPVHFMRATGPGLNPVPVVLTHGWPWTFWDYRDLAIALTNVAQDTPGITFDVIVPSLPGYGFSVPLHRTGVDVATVANLWTKLMRDVLGYQRFGACGGDWGGFVTGHLGHAYPEHLIGVYLTFPLIPGRFGRYAPEPTEYAPDEQWMLERMKDSRKSTEAHVAVHRRDARTLAYAMADSPAGLAAWLWWRRHLWCDGDATEVFGIDDLCTLASLYWFNTSFASAIRIYAEQFTKPPVLTHSRQTTIEVPTGFGIFPGDLLFTPKSVAQRHTNLHRWTVFERGGHFAPAEQPALVAQELRAFFGGITE